MGLLDRIADLRRPDRPAGGDESRYSFSEWLSDSFSFGGNSYQLGLNTTWGVSRAQEITNSLPSYTAAIKATPPAFAAEMVRALVLSQVRFTWRNLPSDVKAPRKLFGSKALAPLERPWLNATTGELIARMEWHAGLAGNAFVLRQPDRLRVLRPDWAAVVYGSDQEPELAAHALDGTLLGYAYWNGGLGVGKPQFLDVSEVAHWSPIPDPLCAGIGMSWLTPAIRDLQGDQLATAHKVKFFENGATANLVIKGLKAPNAAEWERLVDVMESKHAGVANAYRTIYLAAGADATVVGADLKQLDFKATQGAGENRIAVLSRVPAALLGISEGLAGSALNAGNFSAARRMFSDTWVYPSAQDLSACLASILDVPAGAELWFDTADMPLLREDAKDAAEITRIQVATIGQAVRDGFTAESATAAVIGQNPSLLVHTGLVSVQLLPPGTVAKPDPAPAKTDPPAAA